MMLKLLHGDCISRMQEIDARSVDLIVTDPPYNMTKTGNSCRPNYMPGGDILEGEAPNPGVWMAECFRVLSDNAHFYTFCNRNDLLEYLQAAKKVGFELHNTLSMIKDTKMPNRWYLKYTETVLFFRKGKAFAINDMTSRDYHLVSMPKHGSKVHPTQKPLDFITRLVINSSDVGQVVLDPFMGGGTTGVACRNAGRQFIGIEKNPDFFAIAEQRLTAESEAA